MAAALSWGYGIWLAVMALCTIVVIYTDISWYWIPDGIVCVAALANGAAVAGGLIAPCSAVSIGFALSFALLVLSVSQASQRRRQAGGGPVPGLQRLDGYIMTTAAFLSALIGAAAWRLYARKNCIPFGPFLWIDGG